MMASLAAIKAKESLSPFYIASLVNESVTDFNLYIDIGGHMILYAPKPYIWTREELLRLSSEGHQVLFYEILDEENVESYRRICLWPDIDESLPPDSRIGQILDLSAHFSRFLFDHNFSETALLKGRQLADRLLECIKEKPSCIQALEKLKDHHDYTYYHSARVAAYSVAIALELSASDETTLQNISLGCLLHDLGKSGVAPEILQKPGKLNAAEWDQVRRHPEIGIQMVKDSYLDIVSSEIILHHHEREDGRGYPHNISGAELLTEVKIAGFADVFDALTSLRPYQETRTRFEALGFIKDHLISHVYIDAYKAMVHLLHRKN